jgi:hypothetical protein
MDLERYVRVAWRFKYLVLGGFLLACVMAVLAVARPSFDHGFALTYRDPPTYKSSATLLITQQGFPWGRSVSAYLPGDQKTGQPSVPANDPVRLATLTGLYAQLATSDRVRQRLTPQERRDGSITVTAVPAPAYTQSGVLPLLRLEARAPTRPQAVAFATQATTAFQDWLREEQDQGSVAQDERVVVDVVTKASAPVVATKPKKTTGVVVFLAIMAAVLGVAMVLENLRPRKTAEPETAPETAATQAPHIAA